MGKTNTPEWGAGSHTFNPVFGATLNPWDTTRSAGGSSGGASVALACASLPIADDAATWRVAAATPAAWSGVRLALRPRRPAGRRWPGQGRP